MPDELRLTRFAQMSRVRAAAVLVAVFGVTAVFVYAAVTHDTAPPKVMVPADDPESGNDFVLFRHLAEHVRAGENYHDAAFREMRAHRFPTGSVFNFRTPTYAWVLGVLPNDVWGRGLLICLGLAALVLNYFAEQRELGLLRALAAAFLLAGTVKWCLDPDGIYSQELWASMLIGLSLGAFGLGWRSLYIAAGLLALFFRELALPYCVVACGLALWRRRWIEAGVWLVGFVAYGLFLAWHASEVARRMTEGDVSHSDWLCFGGLTFDLVTARMNDFFYAAPGWVVAFYLSFSLVGLCGWRTERGTLAAATVCAYLLAFSVVGNPYNGYWGLLYVPILAFGAVRAPGAVSDLCRASARRAIRLLGHA